MMRKLLRDLKLSTKLNFVCILVFIFPAILTAGLLISRYSDAVEQEARKTIEKESQIAELIFQDALEQMQNLAETYARNRYVTMLLPYKMGKKIGREFAKTAKFDRLDMVTIVDPAGEVLVRSQSPDALGDTVPLMPDVAAAFSGLSRAGIEQLTRAQLEMERVSEPDPSATDATPVLCMTGIAPVFNSDRSKVMAAVIVRRLLNNDTQLLSDISGKLNLGVALFAHSRVILEQHPEGISERIILPGENALHQALMSGKTLIILNTGNHGHLYGIVPIPDFTSRPIGSIVLQKSGKDLRYALSMGKEVGLGIALAGLILIAFGNSVIKRTLVHPIRRLKRGVEELRHDNPTPPLEVNSGDEIGKLTEAFNKMASNLHAYDQKLRIYQNGLESAVHERTFELEMANTKLRIANDRLEETLESLNPGISRLIGENRQITGLVDATLLIVDICESTRLHMILGNDLMAELVNQFFSACHKLLALYSGTFDKSVGDEIRAIFGLPKDDAPPGPYHAFDAVECGLQIIAAAEEVDARLQTVLQNEYATIVSRVQTLPPEDRRRADVENLRFLCRVGINSSDPASEREIDRFRMVMMGAETFKDYTVQGGAAVYAFRLEEMGSPGEVHIGENTRRRILRVYRLAEMQSVPLKGLGAQPRYRVLARRPFTQSIYPRVPFYQSYAMRLPDLPVDLFRTLVLGEVHVKEIKKISKAIPISIPFVEHLAGVTHLCLARAVFVYALAEQLGQDQEAVAILTTAALWQNATRLFEDVVCPFPFSGSTISTQLEDRMDTERLRSCLNDLSYNRHTRHTDIIRLCNTFDDMVFDRSYFALRKSDTLSPREALRRMCAQKVFDPELISACERLMTAPGHIGVCQPSEPGPEVIICPPDNPDIWVGAINRHLSREQKRILMEQMTGRNGDSAEEPPDGKREKEVESA